MRKCAPLKLTMILIAAGVIVPSLNRSAEAGDWFGWHHGQTAWVVNQPTTTQSIMMVPAATMMVPAATTTQLMLAPMTQLQLGTVTAGQTLFVPSTNASLTLTPGLTTSIGSWNTSNVSLQGTTNRVALTLSPQTSSNVVGLSVGANGATDTDSQVVALGLALGGGNKSLADFTKFLEGQAADLFKQAGSSATQQAIVDKLFDIAKGYLSGNGFGIVIDDLVGPIIKRLIAKVVSRVQPSQPSNPANPVIPQGGATFDISGRITLTPTQAGPVTPPIQPPASTLPTSLTPSGGQVAPSP